ncbi:MAG: hypothetical protein KDA45_12445, partial [Planctomycetales bacterium]|nr:hypothetical protein [Planctomycetales bacterium]
FLIIALEKSWQWLLGTNSIKTGSTLERQELQRVLVEGQEAGVLLPIQREIAQNLFTFGVRPVRQFAIPLRALPLVSQEASREEVLREADRRGQSFVGVLDRGQQLVGCYLVTDIMIHEQQSLPLLPVYKVAASESSIQALTRLQNSQCPIAVVLDGAGKTMGVIEKERLTALLLSPN